MMRRNYALLVACFSAAVCQAALEDEMLAALNASFSSANAAARVSVISDKITENFSQKRLKAALKKGANALEIYKDAQTGDTASYVVFFRGLIQDSLDKSRVDSYDGNIRGACPASTTASNAKLGNDPNGDRAREAFKTLIKNEQFPDPEDDNADKSPESVDVPLREGVFPGKVSEEPQLFAKLISKEKRVLGFEVEGTVCEDFFTMAKGSGCANNCHVSGFRYGRPARGDINRLFTQVVCWDTRIPEGDQFNFPSYMKSQCGIEFSADAAFDRKGFVKWSGSAKMKYRMKASNNQGALKKVSTPEKVNGLIGLVKGFMNK